MGQENQHWMNEPDIGSGAKPASQRDIEREQQALGAERGQAGAAAAQTESEEGDTLRQGDHLARYSARLLEDGSYEAQVHVRLTREPERAETYIPVGSFQTEQEALDAARERAQRALDEQEF